MKIRLDYVSNSSSSSFFIVGQGFYEEDLKKLIKKLNYEYDPSDFCDTDLEDKYGLHCEIDGENDIFYIGLEFDSMKDDETKAQFINRVEDMLKKLFEGTKVTIKVEPICEEIYC